MNVSQVAALLERHSPHDDAERQSLDRMRRLASAGDGSLTRDHYVPGHFTCSAWVLSADRQQAALIFHAKLKRWLQPGGHIEPDDADPRAAALREVREEIGLGADDLDDGELFDLDVHVIPARPSKGEPAHEHHDLRFCFVARAGATLEADTDAEAAKWVPLGEISELESDASVMRMVAKTRPAGA